MFANHLLAGMAALAVVGSAAAQEVVVHHVEADAAVAPAVTPNCGGGVVYDDGVFDTGYGIEADTVMVMKFDLPPGSNALDQECVCFTRIGGAPSSMGFQFVLYDDNGPGGQPGTLLGFANATAEAIPLFPAYQFYSIAFPSGSVTLPDTSLYAGARWQEDEILMCGDRSETTPQRTSFASPNNGTTWTNMATFFPTSIPRAMGIRVDAAAAPACVPSSTRLCLEGNRFRVEGTWETSDGRSGVAQVVKLTDDTGYLWFFNPSNVEAVIKIHNACVPPFNRFWVFGGGLTNVRTRIVVTDTKFPELPPKVYVNPQETPFQPIQDNNAFATCP